MKKVSKKKKSKITEGPNSKQNKKEVNGFNNEVHGQPQEGGK